MRHEALTAAELAELAGREIGVSEWQGISQDMVDRFAALTGDDGFPHVDPVRAAATPFGGTIAHGLLLLGLVGGMAGQVLPEVADRRYLLAYGWERIRFTAPVRTGSEVRARFTLASASTRPSGEWLMRFAVVLELRGQARPAMVGELLQLIVL